MGLLGKKRILLIEDDEDVYDFLQPFLMEKGFEVEVAKNGHFGLETLENFEPHLIILDLMMPHMDGFEFLKALLTNYKKRPPALILTGVQEMSGVERALRWGAKAYLTKPVDNDRLLKKIQEILEA